MKKHKRPKKKPWYVDSRAKLGYKPTGKRPRGSVWDWWRPTEPPPTTDVE